MGDVRWNRCLPVSIQSFVSAFIKLQKELSASEVLLDYRQRGRYSGNTSRER
jgi:hypothetical protein